MARIRRNKFEQIEDGFMDLSIDQQVRMLETLNSLHRHAKRMQPEPASSPRQPKTGDEAEAAGRAAHAQAVAGPQALLMEAPKQIDGEYREETKQ